MFLGTIINCATILVGGSIGLVLHKNFPEKIRFIVFQGIGLFSLVIGMQMAFKAINPLILVFSVIIGGIVGELLNLELRLDLLSEKLKKLSGSKSNTFTEGLTTAFLLFCVGSMAILGPINEVLRNDRSILYTKSILDGFSSIALASSLGVGVLFSAIPVFLYQGGITIFASTFQSYFSTSIISELTAVGGLLILGIGINLLDIKKIKVVNMLPSLIIAVVLAALFK
ncbi:MAG: DUF554 domain-containing protein [Patescibacteria group bacterium]